MYLQFGNHEPISSEDFSEIILPLEIAQEPVKIALIKENSYRMSDYFTIVMFDEDAPSGKYYHSLFVNETRRLRGGDVVLQYLPPQRVGHRYHYEIYLQPRELPKPVATRENFYFEAFLRHGLRKIAEITVESANGHENDSLNDQLKEIRPHDFMKHGELTEKEESYCRCVLHVKVGGRARNPYAVCTKSVGTNVRTCGDHYDYDAMPLSELLAYADLKNLKVPDRSARESVIDTIFDWKDGR